MSERDARYRQFIEDTGDLLDDHGLPHMAGRIVGALLVCDPPYLSHDELADQLQASRGSISMATQLLLRGNIVERVSLPGHRRHYYRLRDGLWRDLLSMHPEHLQNHLDLVDKGLELLRDEPIEAKMRLIELQVLSQFILEILPEFTERWERRRPELIQQRLAQLG